jgi:uncharacterized protein YjdB
MKRNWLLFTIKSFFNVHNLPVTAFIIPFCLTLSPNLLFGQTDGIPRGAQLPYTRYESENGVRGGSAALQQTLNHDYNTIAAEASNQKYVSLPSNGSYVEWTTTAAFQGFNMRFTMPDNATGTGNSGSLGLYINGTRLQTINLTSRWAYQYFHGSETEPVQEPGGKTFMEFDEVHFRLANSYPSGTVIRIAKDNGDAFTYGVDFLELEPVPAALAAPANSLSVTDYGANGADNNDDLAAFYSCLNAAKTQGKNVYVPAGRFLLSDRLDFNYSNMIFQGAGIWHTEIFFSTDLQFTGGFLARASNVNIGHFSLNTANNDRFHYGETNPKYSSVHGEPYKIYKGFMGTYGTGSRIHDVWVEHFECGFWIAGYDPPYPIDITTDLIITRARIRNNYADGVNFCQGTNSSVVEYSSIRNSGDDGLAMWPNNALSAPQEFNNIFRYNTIENIWRAGGVAIFGGYGHQVFRNIIKDGVGGSAIRFTQDFPGYSFEQSRPKIVLTDNYIVGCGTSYDLWNQMRGAIEFYCPRGIYDLEFNNTQIINSQRHAINFEGNFNGLNFNNTTIDGTGLDAMVDQPAQNNWGGFGIRANASGNATFTTISYNRLESGEVINHNTGFQLNIVPGVVNLTGITLTPTTASVAEGQTANLTVAYTPSNASNKNVTWTSSNTSVATVTPTGTGTATVTGVAVGTATITVTSAQGGFSKTCTVNVTPAVNITATDASAGEGGNVGVFRIATSATTSNITVNYTISGTATSSDYTPGLSGSVTLTSAAPAANITITPVDDTAFEGAENLTLTLQPGTGFTLGGNTTATISIADNENPPCTAPVIGFTSTAPVIDQTIDAAWSNVPAGTISNVTLGSMPGDFAGSQWRAMYDNTNLYVLIEVKDNNKFSDSGTSWWEDDVAEIFIDGNNNKGTSYDGQNDFQLGFRYNDPVIKVGQNSVTNTTGIVFAMQNITGGYNVEVRIPWSTIGVAAVLGNRIGLDIQVDDDDNGGVRDAQMAAFATTSMAWSNPGLFGSVYLTTCSGQPPVAVTGVTVSPTTATISVGGTQQLTATVSPSNATNKTVSWSSSNTSVATVNSSGLVSGVAAGTATITVTTQDGGKTATSSITVNTTTVPVTGVTVSPTSATLNVGGTQQLTATVAPANATNKNVSWSTSNASVATVNSSGLVTAVAAGSATITVTTQDGAKTATSAIIVNSTSQTPFGGTAWAIPGTIEVENFDNGGEGVAYHDNDAVNSGGQGRTTLGVDTETCSEGGLNVGWTNTGEWLEYTVNVTTTGNYNIDVRTASTLSGGTFHIEFGGVDKTGLMTTSNTGGWQTWTTISKSGVALTAGTQVMRIYLDNANFNLNKVTITAAGSGDPAGVITCYRTSGTMTVNGSLSEAGWNVSRSFSKATVGSPNNTATFGVLWDNTNLYIGARILDANLFSESTNAWDDDAVEIYIDANNNKLTTYDGQDNQIIKNYNKSTVFTKLAVTGLQHGWAAVSGGYTIEVAIPWSQLNISAPAQGTTLGFDIGYDDDDNGGVREHQAVWNGTINNYQNTSAFGSLVLNSTTSGGSGGRMATGESEEAKAEEESAVAHWPTEVTDELHITCDGSYEKVMIIDLIGRYHLSQSILGQKSITLDVRSLGAGFHIVKMRGRDKSHNFRIIRK